MLVVKPCNVIFHNTVEGCFSRLFLFNFNLLVYMLIAIDQQSLILADNIGLPIRISSLKTPCTSQTNLVIYLNIEQARRRTGELW